MPRVEAGTDWRAGWPAGAPLGPVLPRVILSQLVLIKLGKSVRHRSTQAGRQGHQPVLLFSSQELSERRETLRSETLQNKMRALHGVK